MQRIDPRSRTATVRLLSRDEERELGLRARAGDRSARDELVLHNLPLVMGLAKRYRVPDLDDLVAAGRLGLVEAADRYDPARYPATRFATYAGHWIRRGMRDWLREQPIVHTPVYLGSLTTRQRIAAGDARLARCLAAAAQARRPVRRLASWSGDEDDSRGVECDPADPRQEPGESAQDRADCANLLSHALANLTPMEAAVLRLHFGLDCEPLSGSAIGERLGIGREWVRRLRGRAVAKLRHWLRDCA